MFAAVQPKKIEKFALNSALLDGKCISHLQTLVSLKELTVSIYNRFWTEEITKYLTHLTNLEALNLSFWQKSRPSCRVFSSLKKYPKLSVRVAEHGEFQDLAEMEKEENEQ